MQDSTVQCLEVQRKEVQRQHAQRPAAQGSKVPWQGIAALTMSWVGCLLLGCSDEDGDPERERAQASYEQWQESAPTRYVARTENYGFGPRYVGLFVVDDGVVSGCFMGSEESDCTPEELSDLTDPIADLYDDILSYQDCDLRRFELGEEGYPLDFYVDCDEEGWGTRVTCFVAGSTDFGECE